jgi:predicted GNAT family N-acyltransferase
MNSKKISEKNSENTLKKSSKTSSKKTSKKTSKKYSIKKLKNIKTYIYFKPTDSNQLDDIKLLIENESNIVLNTGNDINNKYDSFKNIKEYINRIIEKSGFLCKGLNPEYVSDSFDNADAVIIISSSMNLLPNGNIFGFALINFDEKFNSIYVDVICSHVGIKGVGDIMIKELENISRKILMTDIYLTSVKSAITFYQKYGFVKYDETCNNMCFMIKHIGKNK